ncbi:ATP-binding protein [Patescibacteria group bacterium]|nr:ATP-binding protein [Patescibacteria group bacterium]
MKLIIFNGTSCSGKSTIIEYLMKEDNVFHLKGDTLKRLFSNYSFYTHKDDVKKIVMAVAKEIFTMKYKVISDYSLFKVSRQKIIDLAKKSGYEIVEINLEADFEILKERFNERVKGALNDNSKKISNTSMDRFKELYKTYNKEKNVLAKTFYTDKQSIEELVREIKTYL